MLRLLALTLALVSLASAGDKCRVLAIGGGADKGAYTAGVAIGLMKDLPKGEAEWDVITGNGDGALNAFIIAQTKPGDEETAMKRLDEFWTKFSWSDFYDNWTGWLVSGLFYKPGLYDSSNMVATVNALDQGKIQRWLGVGTTDLISHHYVFFNSTKATMDTMKTGVRASMSTAGIFPYVEFRDYMLTDGPTKFNVDLLHGVNACNSMGYANKDIVVDAVLSSGKKMDRVDASNYKSLQVLLRYLAINSYQGSMKVVNNAVHDHPEITLRTVTFPSKSLPDSLFPYDFSKEKLESMVAQGIADAKAQVAAAQ